MATSRRSCCAPAAPNSGSSTGFGSEAELRAFAARTVAVAGRRLDEANPADARLPDGSRLHAICPPLTPSPA